LGPTEVADGLAAGLADIGSVAPGYDPASFPMANWLTQLAGQSRGGSPYAGLTFGMAQWELGITEPQLVKKLQTRLGDFEDKILALYARGMSTRDIESALVDLYGVTVSHDVIAQVTDAVLDEVRA
jgi:hypothetical protein